MASAGSDLYCDPVALLILGCGLRIVAVISVGGWS